MIRILPIILGGLLLAGCASTTLRHLPPQQFIRMAEKTQQMHSVSWTHYVGCTPKRIYLEHTSMGPMRENTFVYWTELEGLPTEVVEQLRKSGSSSMEPK
jgi:uncharacterized protein YcfL